MTSFKVVVPGKNCPKNHSGSSGLDEAKLGKRSAPAVAAEAAKHVGQTSEMVLRGPWRWSTTRIPSLALVNHGVM